VSALYIYLSRFISCRASCAALLLCALVPVGLRLLLSFLEVTWPVCQKVVVVEHVILFVRTQRKAVKFGSRGRKSECRLHGNEKVPARYIYIYI
jgi:hypothetical protein